MELYHTGFDIIEAPDIHFGRQNADFGQGFYLSGNREFSVRWARAKGQAHLSQYLCFGYGGLLSDAQALEILSVGPQYEQVVVKSEKAAAQLHFLSSAVLPHEEIAAQRAAVSREESAYQDLVGEKLGKIAEILE